MGKNPELSETLLSLVPYLCFYAPDLMASFRFSPPVVLALVNMVRVLCSGIPFWTFFSVVVSFVVILSMASDPFLLYARPMPIRVCMTVRCVRSSTVCSDGGCVQGLLFEICL